SVLAMLGYLLYRTALRVVLGLASGGSIDAILSTAFTSALFCALAANAWKAYPILRALLVDQLPDAILLDVGRALLAALQESELVSQTLPADCIRVVTHSNGASEIRLEGAASTDAALFIAAYRQVFEPVRDQRYLVLRDDARLPGSLWLAGLWRVGRRWVQRHGQSPPTFYPVPQVLGVQRVRAECFARHWHTYVGGGQLIYTRGDDGWKLLLQARAQRLPEVRSLAFQVWR